MPRYRAETAPETPKGRQAAPPDLLAKIAEIERASIDQMREIWRGELGTSPPEIRAYGTLKRILAWRVQEKYLGGLSQEVLQQLERLGNALDRNPGRNNPALKLRPGVMLVREWKGAKHCVRVLPNGFEYLGKTYDSLSVIARTIAGTRWSGPLFFGLKKPSSPQVNKS